MKHVNTRFPDDLYDEMAAAANAEERPVGSWLRIAAKEKLARDFKNGGKSRSSSAKTTPGARSDCGVRIGVQEKFWARGP